MPALYDKVDPNGLLEYSVVYTDRSLNHMSQCFQGVMKDISAMLKEAYNAHSAIVVPGSGSFGMEAAARQFARGKKCLVIRNGWFSYRWSQIFEVGNIPSETHVLKARRTGEGDTAPFAPAPIEEVIRTIEKEKPSVVFAPHVETSSGMILPGDYIKSISQTVHAVGGILVLDCIASGTIWVDMKAAGVDVLISAPQKGWSGPPCAGLVMLGENARATIESTESDSFTCDLKKWLQIMEAYENGAHAYHATMPTESLRIFRDVMLETKSFGFKEACVQQQELGNRVRAMLEAKGISSVAAAGFQAPGVVVSYTSDAAIQSGKRFAEHGLQVAAGVPLMCDEGDGYSSFRLGLFGLDKLQNVDRTVESLQNVVDQVFDASA
ncbi:class V aminotransferase [Chromatiales bacterium (ex Bugula neritina AB1)]|nr:class V aminotransferase [Chromatiales bacterium (ex Bugula neritina AB1)]